MLIQPVLSNICLLPQYFFLTMINVQVHIFDKIFNTVLKIVVTAFQGNNRKLSYLKVYSSRLMLTQVLLFIS